MTRSRAGFHSRGTGRRKSSWTVGPGDSTPLHFDSSDENAFSGLNIIADGLTLVRTRGSFSAYLTAATATSDGFHGAFGYWHCFLAGLFGRNFVASASARSVNWDGWLYHRFFDCHLGDSIGGGGSNQAPGAVQFEVDSKAMRKVSVNEVFVAVVQVSETPTAEIDVFFDSRMLFKLP